MVNVNIEIPEGLHKRAKLAAAVEGVTLKELVIRTLQEQVRQEGKK